MRALPAALIGNSSFFKDQSPSAERAIHARHFGHG
jgi:hypothetical protein